MNYQLHLQLGHSEWVDCPCSPRLNMVSKITFAVLATVLTCTAFADMADRMKQLREQAALLLNSEIQRLESLSNSLEKAVGLSETHYFLASLSKNKDSALTGYKIGVKQANEALNYQHDNQSAQLWRIVNTLKVFQIAKPFRALWQVNKLEKSLLNLKAANKNLEYAGPDRVLAALYAEAPSFLHGSKVKAEHHFQSALRIAPEFPTNSLLYAKFLIKQNRSDEARKLMQDSFVEENLARFPKYEFVMRMDFIAIQNQLKIGE